MTKMKKIQLMISILLTAALFAGCGAGAAEETTAAAKAAAAAETTAAAEKKAGTGSKVEAEIKPEADSKVNAESADTDRAADDVTMRIGGLKGPTSIGMIKIMEDASQGTSKGNYDFMIAGSADELTPLLIKGELDAAAVPVNLVSVLYNNTNGAVKLYAVNTLGVVYIVEKGDSVHSVSDLKGKTIYATGKGSTPEYTLRYILSENGIDPDKDVTIEFRSEPTEIASLLKEADSGIAMLPQPYTTVVTSQIDGTRIAIDLTAEWDALDNGSTAITGAFAVRADWAEAHPEALKTFGEEYAASVEYVNSDPKAAAALVEKFGIVKAAVAEKAIPYCNIVYMTGESMEKSLMGYLQVLFDQNPKSTGGKLPDEGFFCR